MSTGHRMQLVHLSNHQADPWTASAGHITLRALQVVRMYIYGRAALRRCAGGGVQRWVAEQPGNEVPAAIRIYKYGVAALRVMKTLNARCTTTLSRTQ